MDEEKVSEAAKFQPNQSNAEDGNEPSSKGNIIRIKLKKKVEPEQEVQQQQQLELNKQEEDDDDEKEEEEEEEEENNTIIIQSSAEAGGDESNSKGNRTCQYCNKVFTCGKALGGHIRIHLQANKKKQQQQHTICKNVSTAAGAEGKETCRLCLKEFPSRKSLFGHMRCHPEREWRGIKPPPKKTETSSSPSDDEEAEQEDHQLDDLAADTSTDLRELDLPKWGMKGSRGRSGVAASDDDYLDDPMLEGVEDDVKEAVVALLMMAKSPPKYSGCWSKARFEGYDHAAPYNNKPLTINNGIDRGIPSVADLAGVPKKRKLHPGQECGTDMIIDEKGKGKLIDEDNYHQNSSDDQDDREDDDNDEFDSQTTLASLVGMKIYENFLDMKSRGKLRKQKKRKLSDLEKVGEDPTGVKFECNICKKTFLSYQALGGHVSSHNKNSNRLINSSSSSSGNENAEARDEESTDKKMSKAKKEVPHQCEICGKVFPTGQALAGHKRGHTGSNSGEGSSSQIISNGEASSSQNNNRIVFGVDLNEPPPVEDEVATHDDSAAATTGG